MRIFTKKFLFLCFQTFRIVLTVVLEGVTTLFRGLGFFQLLLLMLYLSGLWGPVLRSILMKEK